MDNVDEILDQVREKFGYYDYRDWLRDYYSLGYSTEEMSVMIGRSNSWVNRNLRRIGVTLRHRGGVNNPEGIKHRKNMP